MASVGTVTLNVKMNVRGIGSGKWTGYLSGKPFHRPPARGDLIHEADNRADLRLVLTEPALDGAVRTINLRTGNQSTIRVWKRPSRYRLVDHFNAADLATGFVERLLLPGAGFISPDVEAAWLSTSN